MNKPVETRHCEVSTELGLIKISRNEAGITGLFYETHAYPPLPEVLGELVDSDDDSLLARATEQLQEYLAGTRRDFLLPLSLDANQFTLRVWHTLRKIPYGETTTYGKIAEHLGSKNAAQTVGRSIGRNPISIIVPCHRVISQDGKITGYVGGIDIKRHLLALENRAINVADRLF